MLTNQQKAPIYFDAEILDDEAIQPLVGQGYDSEQVQQAIAETDSTITLIRGIAQGAVLAGFQITSTQYLYLAGSVGLFPAIIAGLPVGASFASSLCYLSFNNGIKISDRQKLGIGVIRTTSLAASSWKLIGDAQNMDRIARNSFFTVTEQVEAYEGIEKPKETNYGTYLTLAAVISIVLFFCVRKK